MTYLVNSLSSISILWISYFMYNQKQVSRNKHVTSFQLYHSYSIQIMSNWKTTADLFQNLIERPKMTEKLLAKPPFKYIFDIITETTKKTGFGNGLYEGDELKADFYGEKNRKITYLQKIISLVEAMSGEKVAANPQKIVAGMQPEQTNELLQLIHKCSTSGKSSDKYVKSVLGGGAAPEQPESKPAQKKKIQRPPSAAKIKKPEDQKPQPPPQKQKAQPAVQEKQQAGGSKKVVEKQKPKVEQPKEQEPPQNVIQKPKGKQEYSKKVQELMEEGEQQVKKQKQVEAQDTKNQNNIAMGRLGKKKKTTGLGQGAEKIISNAGELTDKELDLVKSMIQSICQNTAPLGKSIEFINEDIEAMNKQLQFWRKQYHVSKTKMQNELKITEDALLPIYDKLGEIEDQIKDQKGKIQTAKAQIIKNDSTIRDLLMSVVITK